MRIGDRVRLTSLPPWVARLPAESQRVFEYCVGRTYPIVDETSEGLFVLDVSVDVDERFGGFMNDLRVEPEYLEVVDGR